MKNNCANPNNGNQDAVIELGCIKANLQTSNSNCIVESESVPSVSDEDNHSYNKKGKTFASPIGLVASCLGCVLGTGNIWRFPRIVALASTSKGSLTFLITWIMFLYLWSVPLIITEYNLGRYTCLSPVASFIDILGNKMMWMGAWVVLVSFFISAYFNVIVGWCFYYFYGACAWSHLPTVESESLEIFNKFINSYWPLLAHAIVLVIVGLCVLKGVRGIEMANIILVPIQLLIVIFTFYWSLTQRYAYVGIKFMFTADWGSLLEPKLWVEAATQNAFDTAAGMGMFASYAVYFSRETGAVRYGFLLPMFNNLVSLVCGITLFSTVFSILIETSPTLSTQSIVNLMKNAGQASTGLTFTWIPVLFSKMGIFGRVICGFFFLCLSFAGLSSMIGYIELTSNTIHDFGVSKNISTIISLLITFLVGVPSALYIKVLINQDYVWGFALMLSGLAYCGLVFKYGACKFRRLIVNEYGIGDWKLPSLWIPLIILVVPIEAIGLICWWAYESITKDPTWYHMKAESFVVIMIEWIFAILSLLGLTIFYVWYKNYTAMKKSQKLDSNISLQRNISLDKENTISKEVKTSF